MTESVELEKARRSTIRVGNVGKKKFVYDLWGDSVNVASGMESSGSPGKIQTTGSVFQLLSQQFVFEERGRIEVKGKGAMMTYWLIDRRA